MSFEGTALVLAWGAILVLALAMSGLLRQVRTLQAAIAPHRFALGPRIGGLAPSLDGLHVGDGTPKLLLFLEANCRACQTILPALGDLGRDFSAIAFAAVFGGAPDPSAGGAINVLRDQQGVFADFGVTVTPFAVAVDGEGFIRDAEPIGSVSGLHRFVRRAAERTGVR